MLDDFKPRRRPSKHAVRPKLIPKLDTAPDTARILNESVNKAHEIVAVPDAPVHHEAAKQSKKWWHIFSFRHTHLSRPKWAALMFGLLVLVSVGTYGSLKLYQHVRKLPPNKAVAVKKQAAVVKPTTEPSRLTGLPVDPALNKRPVTGIMIENSPDARPQSGLKDAGIVFEAIAEGGITRFLALFQEAQPDYIGPIRSARPYYLDWALTFDASLAHVGGSPDALSQIKSLGVKDLDQFYNSNSYQRVSSRYAPHNVYSSMSNLDSLNQKKGYTESKFTSWPRKTDKPAAATKITARSIDFAVSGFLYSPHYDYDTATNAYLRSEGGQPHKDERSGAQLAPKVLIALVLNYSVASDGIHSIYATTGSGHMYIFQDGQVAEGTWQKADRNSPYTFTASSGEIIKLNAGQTWVTAVGSTADVTYKP